VVCGGGECRLALHQRDARHVIRATEESTTDLLGTVSSLLRALDALRKRGESFEKWGEL